MKLIKKTLSFFLIAILVIAVFPAENTYAATPKVKITFNANGGKIGSAKTKVVKIVKGKKIGKLPKAKRSGYTFKGWYTKKSDGKKISKSTNAKKKTTYYAQWKKNRTLTDAEKKLVGVWSEHPDKENWWYGQIKGIEKLILKNQSYGDSFIFKSDGTYVRTYRYLYYYGAQLIGGVYIYRGDFKITSKGDIAITNVKCIHTTGTYYGPLTDWEAYENSTIKFVYIPGDGSSVSTDLGIRVFFEESAPEFWKR